LTKNSQFLLQHYQLRHGFPDSFAALNTEMKKIIIALLCFFVLGCEQKNISKTGNVNTSNMVSDVVFNDLFTGDAATTMHFQYSGEKVQTVLWDYSYPSGGGHYTYREERSYSDDGQLKSIEAGTFNGSALSLSYTYKDGLRSSIKSTKNDTIHAVTSFTVYDGTEPTHIENLFGVYGIYSGPGYPHTSIFEFDAGGNLIVQKHTGIPNYEDIVQEKTIIYSVELNPLRNLLETPLPQSLGFYDDLSFYFSNNLPSSIEANYPYVDPVNNALKFEYIRDTKGRVVHLTALSTEGVPRYRLDITYY